jgi:glycerophosphoryl diester phosphodiesterase
MTKNLKQHLTSVYGGRTLVLGHRGAKAYAPMNTIPAFELAADQGADGVELDVHLTKDGHPVIVHDFTVDSTTDGSGLVREMTLAEVKALDAGSWFGPEFAGLRVPTLGEVFEAVGQRLFINVEIKSETVETDGVEQVVADVIVAHGMRDRVIVSSFNPYALQRFRAIMPDVPIGFLYQTGYQPVGDVDMLALMNSLNVGYEALHPHQLMIDADYMAAARQSGHFVNTWTVNDPARAVELRDLGVNAIITDNPDTVIAALKA